MVEHGRYFVDSKKNKIIGEVDIISTNPITMKAEIDTTIKIAQAPKKIKTARNGIKTIRFENSSIKLVKRDLPIEISESLCWLSVKCKHCPDNIQQVYFIPNDNLPDDVIKIGPSFLHKFNVIYLKPEDS